MLVGVFLYTFLRAIPIFGFFIGVFVTLIGIGAMWLTYRDHYGTGSIDEPEAMTEK
jgi:hypothetical protein